MKANEGIRRSTASLVASVDAAAVVLLRPDRGALVDGLTAPRAWVARHGADAATAQLASGALWLIACWVGLALLALAVRTVPGAFGRAADTAARVLLPRALYRAAAGAAGIGVLLSTAGPAAASVPTPTAASAPAPVWPSDATLDAPQWPTSPAGSAPPAAPTPRPDPTPHPDPTQRPDPAPRTDPAPIPAGTAPASHAGATVVVRPGDTLWSIAADHLSGPSDPARTARAWPRWYGANRHVIGADPDLITPGAVLTVPDGAGR